MLATSAVLLSVFMVLTAISISQACTTGEVRLVDSEDQPAESKEGLLQVCQESTWTIICGRNGWDLNTANVACRHLGYLEYGAESGKTDSYTGGVNHFSELSCEGQERSLLTCSFDEQENCHKNEFAHLACGEANCANGEIRLVNGSTNREGRVEVCQSGRWGTVCGKGLGDRGAGLVCSQLGYSTTGSALRQFGEGTGPIYTLDCQDDPNCAPTLSTQPDCTHADDLGVVCSTFDESCPEAIGKPETPGTDSRETITTVDSIITEERCTGIMQTNTGLGVLTALLTAALVAVVVGWIISCVWLQRKDKRKSKDNTHKSDNSTHQPHLHNPVYDPGHLQHNHSYNVTASPTTYSSQGPSYEATGYDVVDRNRPHPSTTPLPHT